MIQSPETLLGMLLPKAKNKEHLFQMAAMMGVPPTDAPIGAPELAPQQGAVGSLLAGQVQQPTPSMKVPPIQGINMPNPGNPSVGAALLGG